MVIPDDIKEILRRDLPKKPLGELLNDLQRDLPEALDDFLSGDNKERQKWVDSKVERKTSGAESIEIEDSDANTEETTELPELHWLADILRFKPASSEEHESWAKQIEAGLFAQEKLDMTATLDAKSRSELEKVVETGKSSSQLFMLHNLRLVWSIARRAPRLLSSEEHFQNGIFGLARAIEGWDWRQGFQFSTYASWWIRQSIYRAMSDTAYTIRIPVHMLDKVKIETRESDDSEFESSKDELLVDDHLNATEKNRFTDPILMAKNAIYRSFSYEMIADQYDFLLEYQVDPFEDTTFDYALNSLFIDQLAQVLYTITEREEAVIRYRYGMIDGEPKTLEEIGTKFGVTRERIRQIESKSIAKLRHPSRSQVLKDYLGSTLSGE
jgi:RNA polymerase primary sigma factor